MVKAKEKWERNFEDICFDAKLLFDEKLTWKELSKIVIEKWEPLADIDIVTFDKIVKYEKDKRRVRKYGYLFNTELCAFCKKAELISGVSEYGKEGATCKACILDGRCFHHSWYINKIFHALLDETHLAFKYNIKQGVLEVKKLTKGK